MIRSPDRLRQPLVDNDQPMSNWQRQLRFYTETVFGSGLFAVLLIASFIITLIG